MNKTKLIAGNIIPAISTTTAFVSGLISMEIYSLIQNKSIEGYRNGYCNLALPIFQLSEPVECTKRKYKEYEWSNWSKIDLKNVFFILFIIILEKINYFTRVYRFCQ